MWCTKIAGGAFLIFFIVVSGDIGDHRVHINPVITPRVHAVWIGCDRESSKLRSRADRHTTRRRA